MKKTENIQAKTVVEKKIMHGVISIAAFLLLYFTIHFYTEALMFKDQEVTAILVTIYLIGGVYTGRYLTHLLANKYKTTPNQYFILLIAIITASMIWLFVYAQYILDHRSAFNILLLAFPLLLLSLAAGILIKLVRTTIQRQLQSAKAQAEHSQSELELLQSQLSPHFLFNTLNNMYGLSISRPEKIPPLLLKLSDLLRYSVYDVKEAYVPLKNEIAYILNYIDFEKIRIGEKLVLNSSLEHVTDDRIKIAPMLLIVFVENAFKHSKNTAEKKICIDISLQTSPDSIVFSITNTHSPAKTEPGLIRKDGGLGLANVRKRLDLLYADAYNLDIRSDEKIYSVMLQLKVR